jgi:hypothetical protein
MKRTIAGSLALAVTLLGPAASNAAPSNSPNVASRGSDMQQTNRDRGEYADRWGDNARSSGAALEGRWIAKGRYDVPPMVRRGMSLRATALPPRLVIDQRRNMVRVEDFNGRVLQEIVIGGQNRGGESRDGAVFGQWHDSMLMTVRTGAHNTRIVQTFEVSNRGRTLVVSTRQDGRGTKHDVEFTSVYQRA